MLSPYKLAVLLPALQDKTGHREPLRGALYNATFHVAVSADEGGTVCVWNMQVLVRVGTLQSTARQYAHCCMMHCMSTP